MEKQNEVLERSIQKYEEIEFHVATVNDRDEVLEIVRQVKSMRSKVVEFFRESKESTHKAWKAVVANEKHFTDRLDDVEHKARKQLTRYDDEQSEIRRKEAARLQAIADEKARRDREALMKRAEKLKTPEKKEALLEEAEEIVAPTIAAEEEKVRGVAKKKIWKFRVINESLIPREWLLVDEKGLGAFARATKGAKQIPGIEFYSETSLSIS